MHRFRRAFLSLALVALGSAGPAVAQHIENGRRLAERWCVQCHAIGSAGGAQKGVPSFASIAQKQGATADTIASFLELPHATMPNLPLSHDDARDLAAFIIKSGN